MARTYRYPFLALLIVPLLTAISLVFHGIHSTATGQGSTDSSSGLDDAERQQVWSSPEMLRARSWVQDYVDAADPADAATAAGHLQTLENMSPAEMKLFAARNEVEHQRQQKHAQFAQQAHQMALKHSEAAAQAQQAWYQTVHKAENAQAMAANRQTQQSFAAINQEESAAANLEQQKLNTQAADANEMQAEKLDDLNTAPVYGYGGYGYPGWGGYHYHYHFYPGD